MQKISINRLRQRRSPEGGQAIAEMAVCLIALMAVILGFLLVSTLAHENVSNVILSRQEADKNFRNSQSSSVGKVENIAQWNYGERGVPFNNDDTPVLNGNRSGEHFSRELIDNSGKFDFRTAGGNGWLPDEYNALRSLQVGNMMVDAANLSAGVATESDPLAKRGLNSLKEAFRNILGVNGTFQLTDYTFMPVKPDVTEPEQATGE